MSNPFNIFKVRKGERCFFIIALIVFITMNATFIRSHYPAFTQANNGHIGAYALFGNKLNLSGYDPFTYMTITQYTTRYELNRHPLITIFLYPLYLINHWIMTTFDFNAAMFIIAIFVILASVYSALFMTRILQELMKLKRKDAYWLTALLFSFGSIMTSSISPDLFIFSMFMLTLSLYVFGKAIINHRTVAWYKTAFLYLFTTGITITNGVKVLIGMLFVNGKKAFRARSLFLNFILPSVIIIIASYIQYENLYLPKLENDKRIFTQKQEKDPAQMAKEDSIARFKRELINGKQHTDVPYFNLINTDVDHWNCTLEWFFGESIQMHQDYPLVDIYMGRPMVVHYRHWWNYAIEVFMVMLFFVGIWIGRRNKNIQMLVSWFAIDIIIHIILGFGLDEANINGCHWMFFIPVALSCIYNVRGKKYITYIRPLVAVATFYLWIYNGIILFNHLI